MAGTTKLMTAGGGGVNITPASSIASDVTVNVPSVNCTLLSNKTAGTVLQVVNATYSTQVDSTSGSWVDTGLTATITPTSSTNKILVIVNHQISISSGTGYGNVSLLRGASFIDSMGINFIAGNTTTAAGLGTCYLDSPATTSPTTYKTQIQRVSGGGTFTSQQNSATATIALLEIAA